MVLRLLRSFRLKSRLPRNDNLLLVLTIILTLCTDTVFSSEFHNDHRHRLIGSRSKTGMAHSMILYHESSSNKKLNFELAKQNLEEIIRVIAQIDSNTDALIRESSKEDIKLMEKILIEQKNVIISLKEETGKLKNEMERKNPSQDVVHIISGKIYKEMKKILEFHRSCEKIFNIGDTEEPK